jgi:nucleoside-diphosphate-sugar epimerase
VQFGDAKHPRAMISSYRAAEAAVLAARSVGAPGQAIHVADLPHPSLKSLIEEIRKALSVNGSIPHLPRSLGWGAARCFDALRVLTGASPPFGTSVFNKLFAPLSLDCRKAEDLLGLGPGCDLARGISEEVAWLRAAGRVAALPANGVR